MRGDGTRRFVNVFRERFMKSRGSARAKINWKTLQYDRFGRSNSFDFLMFCTRDSFIGCTRIFDRFGTRAVVQLLLLLLLYYNIIFFVRKNIHEPYRTRVIDSDTDCKLFFNQQMRWFNFIIFFFPYHTQHTYYATVWNSSVQQLLIIKFLKFMNEINFIWPFLIWQAYVFQKQFTPNNIVRVQN